MKKNLIVASIACACASAFNAYADAETPPRYLNWFTGINLTGDPRDVSKSSDLAPENGSWTTLGTGTKTWNTTSGFEYDLDSDQTVVFTAEAAAAPETNTITRVELTSYFTPVVCAAYADLAVPSSGDFAFAAVAKTNADQTAEFTYRVWTGGDSWTEVDGAAPNYEEDIPVTLIASFDYRGATKTVDYAILTNGVTNAYATAVAITGAGTGVSGITCDRSGNVIAFNGEMVEAIAEIGENKYISLTEARNNATDNDVINVLAETDEDITLNNGITLSNAVGKVTGTVTAGSGSTVTIALNEVDVSPATNGTYTVSMDTAVADGGTRQVTISSDNKQIADSTTEFGAGTITVTIHTKTSLLTAIQHDELNTSMRLAVDNTVDSPLRVFLEKYSSAYRATDASTASIQEQLRATPDGSNGLALWQDYVLGIEPDTSVKPVGLETGDSSTTEIQLEVPNLVGKIPTDGYAVSYKVYKEGVAEPVATASAANAIQIPVSSSASGKYTVEAVLTPNN